ncbi:MAG: hypothetical protein KJ947_20700 [Alphaproteobacteria bacterium]|jgi:hypothetical protein|nr:hypothetical protein [Alphaproteobacteria bacterium]MBU1551968.1 hypothetical protein [Alphaproteobacteria bacterium]MBU2337514.1 hypothetical protein [Alphaproteobacteria bacterium]MBU2388155.1 hypothetical protein [Alphaproteobacteria bacterium]
MTFFDAKRLAYSEPHRRAPLRADHGERFQERTKSQALWDIPLTPAVGAVLTTASTVVVKIDAQLLKRVIL